MIKRGEGRQRFLRRVEERLERMSLRESVPASFGSDLAFYCIGSDGMATPQTRIPGSR